MDKTYLNYSLEDIEGEEWQDIPMYDGMLLASNYGRIKRVAYYDVKGKWRKEKIIHQQLKKGGDIKFLAISYKRKTLTILQLVGMAFYGYLKDGYCFQRKDYDQYNCRADNILILSIKESRQRPYDLGTNIKSKHGKGSIKKSKYIFKRLSDGKEFITSELKNEYPKQAFRNIKAAVKNNKMSYGTFWEQKNI